jgi:hypothetical protein
MFPLLVMPGFQFTLGRLPLPMLIPDPLPDPPQLGLLPFPMLMPDPLPDPGRLGQLIPGRFP